MIISFVSHHEKQIISHWYQAAYHTDIKQKFFSSLTYVQLQSNEAKDENASSELQKKARVEIHQY